ncbi:MAG: TonB-dependent receptor, partial [Acidobacteriota bacterium]|nr:TonB-dependent receptor [Acidobacteriota bacterium]
LPFGRGKRFGGGAGPIAGTLIGGWQLTGITTFSMGQFQTPGLGVDWINAGAFTSSRPNIIGDYRSARSLPDAYVNPAAFATPATHVEGNAARNSIEQPGINNWDIGVLKNTRVRERFNAQFRWEMFNAWNHTQYGAANLNLASANFGKIGGLLVGPRRTQFGLRLVF